MISLILYKKTLPLYYSKDDYNGKDKRTSKNRFCGAF